MTCSENDSRHRSVGDAKKTVPANHGMITIYRFNEIKLRNYLQDNARTNLLDICSMQGYIDKELDYIRFNMKR